MKLNSVTDRSSSPAEKHACAEEDHSLPPAADPPSTGPKAFVFCLSIPCKSYRNDCDS